MAIDSSVWTPIKALVVSALLGTCLIASYFGSSQVGRDWVCWEKVGVNPVPLDHLSHIHSLFLPCSDG
jgi:hypothetical protein